MINNPIKKAEYLLRIGIAFGFIYAAVSSFIDPDSWIGFLPSFLTSLIPGETLLTIFSIYEIILGLWLILGKKLIISSFLACLTLFGIVIFNLGNFIIIFRDVTILLSAIALLALSYKNKD